MKLNEKINKKIDQIYSKIFDLIEDDNYKEAFTDFRDAQIVKLFAKYLQLQERIKKEKHERVNEHIEYLQAELEEFNEFLLLAQKTDYISPWNKVLEIKVQVPSWDTRKEEFIDSKFYELFFNCVESNKDTKEVFKFLISEMTKKFNLSESKIYEYKKFVVTYFFQREKVSLFYDLFLENESLLHKNFNLHLKKISGIQLNKGKLSLELSIKREVSEILNKIFENIPGGIAMFTVPVHSIWLYYLNTKILKNNNPGTLGELIVTPEDYHEDKYGTPEYWGNSVLIHERKHMEYNFTNFFKEVIAINEKKDRIKKILKNKKSTENEERLREIVEITTSISENHIKDELLATLEGTAITFVDATKKFSRNHKIKRQDYELGNTTYKSETIFFPWKELKLISMNYDVSKIKKILLKYAKNAEQKQAIEDSFRREDSKYKLVIEGVIRKMDNLISRFPYEKQFISHYLERTPLLLWPERLDYFENILKLKNINTVNKTRILL